MSKTKNAIITHALALFNEKGISNVSLRTIADDMNISVGNLHYHFKKREDIIETLYLQLVQKIDAYFLMPNTSEDPLQSFFEVSKALSLFFFEYRFFLLDFVQIIRQHEMIRTHYKQLTVIREQQFLEGIAVLVDKGVLRDELLKDEYKNLFKRLQILSDFWISSATIQSKKISKKVVEAYVQVINQSMFPYLTAIGREKYMNTV